MRLSKLKLSIGAFLVMLSLALVAFAGASLNQAHAASSGQSVNAARMEALHQARSKHNHSSCTSSGNFYASPCAVRETTSGNVSFALIGSRLIPLTSYTILAPSLKKACAGGQTIDGTVLNADFTGSINATASAAGCVAGRYTIELQENVSPFTVYSTVLTIKQP